MHESATQLNTIIDAIEERFPERREMATAAILALLSGQHFYVRGEPGTAKSAVIRFIMDLLLGAKQFSVQLTSSISEMAVTGPIDIPTYRDTGQLRHNTDGYLPWADVAYLDEVDKASKDLGQWLLTALNEGLHYEVDPGTGHRSARKIPLSSVFTASNGQLDAQSEQGAAMYDRLLVRTFVEPLKDSRNMHRMLMLKFGNPELTQPEPIEWAELKQIIDSVVPAMSISPQVMLATVELRQELAACEITVSDRRFGWAHDVMKAHAFLRGADTVEMRDIEALKFVMWDEPDDISKVIELCKNAAIPYQGQLNDIAEVMAELNTELDSRSNDRHAFLRYLPEVLTKVRKVKDDLDLVTAAAGDDTIGQAEFASWEGLVTRVGEAALSRSFDGIAADGVLDALRRNGMEAA